MAIANVRVNSHKKNARRQNGASRNGKRATVNLYPEGRTFRDRLAEELQDPEFRMLYAGRMDNRAKGIDVLIRAVAELRVGAGGDDVRVALLGDGPARGEFEELARSMGVADACGFEGWHSPEGVAAKLCASHCFAMPTDYETFGVAFMEALACGRPVIGCAVGALPEFVPPWAGELTSPRDPGAFARGVAAVRDRLASFDPTRLSDHAVSVCSREAFRLRMVEVYGGVLAGRRPGSSA